MRIRTAGSSTDIDLTGTVWDACDFLAALARTDLRSFIDGPWGKGNEGLAKEMVRRLSTDPCQTQCFVVSHKNGENVVTQGCTCSSGWQYTDDNHVAALEGCGPNDLWSDARALLKKHYEIGRGPDQPILCDCDDLTSITAGCWAYMDPNADVRVAITKPYKSNMAHAYVIADKPWQAPGEPLIKISVPDLKNPSKKVERFVFDPAGRWGMKRPVDSFYADGEVAVFPVRREDLNG